MEFWERSTAFNYITFDCAMHHILCYIFYYEIIHAAHVSYYFIIAKFIPFSKATVNYKMSFKTR